MAALSFISSESSLEISYPFGKGLFVMKLGSGRAESNPSWDPPFVFTCGRLALRVVTMFSSFPRRPILEDD